MKQLLVLMVMALSVQVANASTNDTRLSCVASGKIHGIKALTIYPEEFSDNLIVKIAKVDAKTGKASVITDVIYGATETKMEVLTVDKLFRGIDHVTLEKTAQGYVLVNSTFCNFSYNDGCSNETPFPDSVPVVEAVTCR